MSDPELHRALVRGHRWALHRWPAPAPASAGARPPRIVALHGFGGGGLDFAPLVSRLPGEWLAPDLLGHGESDAPGDAAAYSMPALAGGVAALLDAVAPGPIDLLIGYSFGGRVALSLLLGELAGGGARSRPRPRGLVLVGATPGIRDPDARAERVRADEALASAIESRGIAWFADHWRALPILAGKRRIAADARAASEARLLAQRPAGLAGALRGAGTGAMPPLWDALGELDLPTLAISGAEDPKFSAIAHELAAAAPRAEHVVLPGVGHSAHLEDPAAFCGILEAFLARLDG